MKKLLSLGSVLAITSAFLPLQAHAVLKDVPNSHPYAQAIAYAFEHRIVEGYNDGTFKPDSFINRAEFVKIAAETFDSQENLQRCGENPTFSVTDVQRSDWFAQYVCAASSGHGEGDTNPVQGNPDGTFRPGEPVNFVEAAKIISKYTETRMIERRKAENNPNIGNLFTVKTDSTEWYAKYVAYMDDVKAIPLSIVRFSQPITRGEMAEMIYRIKTGNENMTSQRFEDLEKGTIVPLEHISMIYDYYRFLESPETISQAFSMSENNVNLETFKTTHKDVAFVTVYRIQKTDTNAYAFKVLIYDDNGYRKAYDIKVNITPQNKLKIVSSTEVNEMILEEYDLYAINDYNATITFDNGDIVLTLYRDGIKTEVKRLPRTPELSYNYFDEIRFAPNARFLTYRVRTTEASSKNIFDIVEKREVHSALGEFVSGFTYDNKYYYGCTEAGLYDGEIGIYSLPNFTKLTLLGIKDPVVDCGVYTQRHGNTLTFTTQMGEGTPVTHEFDFDTETLK